MYSPKNTSAMNNSSRCAASLACLLARVCCMLITVARLHLNSVCERLVWQRKSKHTNELHKPGTCYKLLINHKRRRDGDCHPGRLPNLCVATIFFFLWGEIPLQKLGWGTAVQSTTIVNSKQVISAAIVEIWNVIFESGAHRLALTESKEETQTQTCISQHFVVRTSWLLETIFPLLGAHIWSVCIVQS